MSPGTKMFIAGALVSPLVLKFAWLLVYVCGFLLIGWVALTFLEIKKEEQENNNGERSDGLSNGS